MTTGAELDPAGQGSAAPPARLPPARLPPAVIWFGVVSFLTDASGEMIYPLLPLFLTSVLHGGVAFVGLVEGVAESTAALFKIVSGRVADAVPRKKPLVVMGYGLSSLVRPLVSLAGSPLAVLAVRFVDRVGKGVRSSPRDALLAEVTPASQRGAAYGFHQAMDNGGAVVGPLLGYGLLVGGHVGLRAIFAAAALPGALAVAALVFGVKETARAAQALAPRPVAALQHDIAVQQQLAAPQQSPPAPIPRGLSRYLLAVAVFSLGNASDAFLLLRAADTGLDASRVLLLWTLHNAVKALLGKRLGALSDRHGRRRLIAAGWSLYALTYLGFGLARHPWQIWTLFAVYGLYYALVEGAERALVADLAPAGRRGSAFGAFHAVVGLAALPASLLFGRLYQVAGALSAFSVAAGLAAVAAALLARVPKPAPESA